jgi:hypothetical protein
MFNAYENYKFTTKEWYKDYKVLPQWCGKTLNENKDEIAKIIRYNTPIGR